MSKRLYKVMTIAFKQIRCCELNCSMVGLRVKVQQKPLLISLGLRLVRVSIGDEHSANQTFVMAQILGRVSVYVSSSFETS